MEDTIAWDETTCYGRQTGTHTRSATEPDITHWRQHPSERLNAMRRSLARALYSPEHASFLLRPQPKLEMLVNQFVCSLTKESIQFLTGPEGEAALAFIVSLLTHATSQFVVTDEAKLAIRVCTQEATTGLIDGLHRRLQEHMMRVPRLLLCFGVVVVGAYGALLAVGLLLCLWRFTLFGVAQEKSLSDLMLRRTYYFN
ncbi:hypothetical protein KC19_10G054600 [Ceratodon purpureus]|uniref:Uncharacterized protein n=1 Tax=Ceratodon purpureus TaxID=3225 RepID=A0A8T0GJS5_CERPU|nr:hypothetical protein KC19_10G054600 [Ceratodon purpureus]